MKRIIYLIVTAFLISGCATMGLSKIASTNEGNLEKLSEGMSEEEVLRIMGTKRVRGTIWDFYTAIDNPFRSEVIQAKSGKALKVLYYFTGAIKSGASWETHTVTNNELTPILFEDGKLIGYGIEFLQENLQ